MCGRRGQWDRIARGPSEGRRKGAGCTGRREGQGHCGRPWGPRGWRVGTRQRVLGPKEPGLRSVGNGGGRPRTCWCWPLGAQCGEELGGPAWG